VEVIKYGSKIITCPKVEDNIKNEISAKIYVSGLLNILTTNSRWFKK